MALDPDNAQALCTTAQRAALNCPKASIVGTATALLGPAASADRAGVLRQGPADSARPAASIPTLPKLWIPLSADGVTIDVNASSEVD